jgi:hypothetical protein
VKPWSALRSCQIRLAESCWSSFARIAALSLTLPKLPAGTKRLFVPDPALVAEVDQLAKSAADGYVGETDRSGDPTQVEAKKVKADTYEKKPAAPAAPLPGLPQENYAPDKGK